MNELLTVRALTEKVSIKWPSLDRTNSTMFPFARLFPSQLTGSSNESEIPAFTATEIAPFAGDDVREGAVTSAVRASFVIVHPFCIRFALASDPADV